MELDNKEAHTIYRLGDLVRCYSGGTPDRSNPKNFGGSIPWIKSGELNKGLVSATEEFITEEGLNNSSAVYVNRGTLLLALYGATTGVVAVTCIRATINQAVLAIVPIRRLDKYYLYYWFRHKRSIIVNRFAQGGQSNISADIVKNLFIHTPPLPYQRRCRTILMKWDACTKALDHLIEAKTKLKKALSQKLLTGQIRFPGFGKPVTKAGEIPEGWNTYLIDDIAYEVSKRNTSNIDLPVILCSKHRGFVSSLEFFNKQVFSNDKTKYKVIGYWQFGFPTNHVEEGSIGLNYEKNESLLSPIYIVFETDRARVYPPYLFYMLKTERYKHLFSLNTEASVERRGNLRWSGFSKISILLPPLGEQVMIARFVSLLQDEIDNLTRFKEHVARQQDAILSDLLLVRSPYGN